MSENKTIVIASNLRVYDDKSKVKIETSPDTLLLTKPLYLHFDIPQGTETEKLDYLENLPGTLVYKSSLSRKELVFDINSEGELIVIGPSELLVNINSQEGNLLFDSRSFVWFLEQNYINAEGVVTTDGEIIVE